MSAMANSVNCGMWARGDDIGGCPAGRVEARGKWIAGARSGRDRPEVRVGGRGDRRSIGVEEAASGGARDREWSCCRLPMTDALWGGVGWVRVDAYPVRGGSPRAKAKARVRGPQYGQVAAGGGRWWRVVGVVAGGCWVGVGGRTRRIAKGGTAAEWRPVLETRRLPCESRVLSRARCRYVRECRDGGRCGRVGGWVATWLAG
jgi:hypothetical protein